MRIPATTVGTDGNDTRATRPRWTTRILVVIAGVCGLGVVFAMFGFGPQSGRGAPPARYDVEVVATYPHDVEAFCQGLVIADDKLFETTGHYGKSTVRRVDLETGKVLQQTKLEDRLFGEGLTALDGKLYQVTWKTGEGFVYDQSTLKVIQKFRYGGQGWGLTTDGKQLILSDGTGSLRFLDPKTFKVTKRLEVRSEGRAVDDLNELEYVDGEIYANVWLQEHILRISPETGRVTGVIDLSPLVAASGRANDDCILNGIAYDAESQRLFVTGKWWPKLYEIRLKAK